MIITETGVLCLVEESDVVWMSWDLWHGFPVAFIPLRLSVMADDLCCLFIAANTVPLPMIPCLCTITSYPSIS
jgi:hypothetical protein